MIKIINAGQITFTAFCNRCGCEFEYELPDIEATDVVICPRCKHRIEHKGVSKDPYVLVPIKNK